MAARTRNAHLAAIIAFGNWCVQTHRLVANPFNRMPKANEKADPRRRRRALTEEELVRLLDVARSRPLVEAMTVRRGQRKGQAVARVRDETRRRLERLGWERALIYKTLVLTGLRKGELASLTVGQLEQDTSDGRVAYAVLMPNDEKNGQGSEIPLRPDLAADLRAWLTSKLELAQEYARLRGQPIPSRLPPETPLLDVPDGLLRIFNLDLVAAGLAKRVKKEGKWVIDKRDDRGRTIDVHALRHTFGTHLSKGGVAPRTGCAPIRL
jgi:integrase